MEVKTTMTLTHAQAQLPRLVRAKQTIAISRHGQTEAFLVPRERMELILETMELLANPAALAAVRRDRSGKGRYLPLSVLDEDPGRT
jgi:PHD/YefM family antitoxin component YafN of YafNO toxin-antitoxin module